MGTWPLAGMRHYVLLTGGLGTLSRSGDVIGLIKGYFTEVIPKLS